MKLTAKEHLLNTAMWVLAIITVAVWCFNLGRFSVSVQVSDELERTHERYQQITVYEDGSYRGELRGGYKVSGCIEGGRCNDHSH